MIPALYPDSDNPAVHKLCPTCGSPTVRITTSMMVHFDVIYEASTHDFSVIDEMLGDAMWDACTDVSCHMCKWKGTVGDLRQRS